MELNSLYNIAEKENVKIYDWQIEDIDGMYLNYENINAIALNYDRLGTYVEEKCTLAEELGHYYMDATYPASCTDKVLIDKQEYRAKKWSYYALIPFEKLKSAVLKRIWYSLCSSRLFWGYRRLYA
mgnify:CR=1 FL=1